MISKWMATFDQRSLGTRRLALSYGLKAAPSASSALIVVDVQNCFLPGGSLAVKEG